MPNNTNNKISLELKRLYEQDQKDRSLFNSKEPDKFDWKKTAKRDKERLERIKVLDKQNFLITGQDMYYAAMIYQHGKISGDYRRAKELSEKGMKLGDKECQSLFPKVVDRYLLSIGKAQIWGTQWQYVNKEKWILIEPFDKNAKTNKERIALGVNIDDKSKDLNS